MPSSIPGGLPQTGREFPERGIRGTIPGQIGDFPQYYTRDDNFRSVPTSLAIPGQYRELTGVAPGDSRFVPSVRTSSVPTDARSWLPGNQQPTVSDSRVPPDYVPPRMPYDSASGYQISSRDARVYPGTFQQTSDAVIGRPDTADRLVSEDTASSQTQVQTGYEGTAAEASSAGRYRGLGSQTQVQGGYSGNGSFSAQAQSGFTGGVTQSQVRGGRQGGLSGSSAQVERVGSAQSQVQVGQPSGAASSSAQGRFSGGTTQVQAQSGGTGGSAGAQAQSSGLSSSQAQVNVGGGEATQESGFQGTVSASSHGGYSSGQSQTQLQGGFDSGRTYVATAQGGFDSNLIFQGSVPQPGSIPSFPLRVGGTESSAAPGFVSGQRESTVNGSVTGISRPLETGISRQSEIRTSRTQETGQVGTQQGLLPPSEMFPYPSGYVPAGGRRDSYLPGRTSETDRSGVLSRPDIPQGRLSGSSIPSHLTNLQKPGVLQPGIPMTDSRQLGYLPGRIQQPTHVPSFARPEYESPVSRPLSQLPASLQSGYKLDSEQRPFHIPGQTQTELQSHLIQPLPPLPLQPTSKTDRTQIQSRPSLLGPGPISSLPTGTQPSYPPHGIGSGGILIPGYLPDGHLPGQVPYPSHLPGMVQPRQFLPPGYLPSVSQVDRDFQPPAQPSLLSPDFHRQPRPDLRQPDGVQPGISQVPEPQISPPKPLETYLPARLPGIPQIPSLIPEPQISPPKPLETYLPARLPGIPQIPSLIPEPQISPPKPLDDDLSARPQPKRTITLPESSTRRTIVRPSQIPGVPEPDATDEESCCEALKNLRRRCCDRRTGTQNGSSCCSSKAGKGRPVVDIDDDFDSVGGEEPCKIVKAICYIVYKPVGKARVCKPTNTNGC
ncbi:arginine-glutamic acid dipeptide repeats protein-like [Stegodyphus dumicola]|uniref:arginine-glutamic acid dipeptide repeats protein-like n=1 Tax=Stegodyphus dumicola TaxID=202533 RepID=UPI0015AA20F2|nr:arginine-glutamic acid dipeptide repeats protein-like [Stegodyphus dumicola]